MSKDCTDTLKKYCEDNNGKITLDNNKYFVIKLPYRKVTNAKYKNFIGRIKHLVSKTRCIPYIPYKNGYFTNTLIYTKGTNEVLQVQKEVNEDGSDIESKVVFGDFFPTYIVCSKNIKEEK